MKCVNCDAEIKDGSIYCPVCGKEAQMVDSYTSLEDDFLHSLLREEINPKADKKKHALSAEEQLQKKQRNKRVFVCLTVLLLAVVITIGVVLKLFVDYNNENSYDYQMKMAQEEMDDGHYENALTYFARVLAINPNDVISRMEMAKIYVLTEENDAAVVLLTEVIRLDATNIDAFECLIEIYLKNEQYTQIQKLADYTNNKEVKKLLDKYIVEKPRVYPSGDIFYDVLEVTAVSLEGAEIYYTTDGSNPITNGKRYMKGLGILLDNSGLYTVRVVCKNKEDIYSEVVSNNYQIVLEEEIETELETEIGTEVTVEDILDYEMLNNYE